LKFSLKIFKKKTQISNFMKIRPVGAELFHADGRTDMTMLIVAFRDFPQAPKKCMSRGGFETAIPVFGVSKILRTLKKGWSSSPAYLEQTV
jgi:hypothetical protein